MMPTESSMMGEKPPPTDANGVAASPFAWAESFMETISKYSRNSERHLYVYGISISRCAVCRQRLSEGAEHCEHCGQEVPTKSKACAGCKTPKPGIWCYECDAYFCEPCHKKPHGLVLGGDKLNTHHCYAVDGSSGKLLKYGSLSDSMVAMAKAARRAQMKLREEKSSRETVAASGEAKPSGEASGHAAVVSDRLRAEEKTTREKQRTAKETALVANRSPPSPEHATSATAVDATITALRESRKRKTPTVDLTTASPPELQQPRQHPPPVSQRVTVPPPTRTPASGGPTEEGDGRSLYDKLRMQNWAPGGDRRIKSEASAAVAAATAIALRSQQNQSMPVSQPLTASATPSSSVALPPTVPTAHAVPSSHFTTTPSASSISTASTPTPIASAVGQASHDPVSTMLRPVPQLPPTPTFGFAPTSTSRSSTPTHNGSGGGAHGSTIGPLASATLTGDPLKGAVVEVYDRVNKYVADIEEKINQLTDHVRRATTQNVVHAAAQISERISQYQAMLPAAEEQRNRALAKVIFFSNDMRAFAVSLPTQQLADIPRVLKGCHTKCLSLGRTIEELQAKLQQLRNTIDAAADSGDVATLLRLQSFSEEIERTEATIRQVRKDRDGQFKLMFQFSKRLREAVRAERLSVTAPGQRPSA